MNKFIATSIATGLLCASSAFASISISFGLGQAYSSTNTSTTMPLNTRYNLLSLDSGSWTTAFPDLVSTFSNLTNSWTPAGSTLVGSFTNNNDGGTPGNVAAALNSITYGGNLAAGKELLLVGYANVFGTNGTGPGLGATGFFFRGIGATQYDGSDMTWALPADGFGYSLFAYTLDQGGSFANSQFTSGAGSQSTSSGIATSGGFTTVPEPSTYALLAMGAAALGGYVIRRRKRD